MTDSNSFALDMSRPRLITIIGKCGSGKSVCAKQILKTCCGKGIFSFGRVYTATKALCDDWTTVIPEKHVFENFSDDHLKAYVEKLKEWKIRNKKPIPHNFLILDDLLGIINVHSRYMKWFLSCHRHTSTTVVIISQYLIANISTQLRTLCDYAVIFGNRFRRDRKNISDFAGQLCDSEDEFLRLMDSLKKHEAILYNSHGKTKEEAYMFWKAELPGEFKLDFN